MKIGIVCYPTFGGSGVVATELGKALAAKGHQVHFISYDLPFRLENLNSNIYYHEVRMYNYPLFDHKPYELMLTSKMVEVAKYEGLDLFHVHYAIPHSSAAYMAREILAKQGKYVPYVTTLHGTDITLLGKDASFEPVITFAINQSNAVTSVSEFLKNDTYRFFEVTREIDVIPNFVCLENYAAKSIDRLKQYYAPNDEKVLIHISNFRKVKRVEDVVKAFAGIRKNLKAKLIMIGDGPERSKVEALCRELGTCADTHFMGKLKETEALLGIADLFFLPSETESFGLSALEAMATSTPVISSNAGGLPEVNVEGETGFLLPIGDVDGMIEKSLMLLNNNELLEKFKSNARKRAETFKIENILPAYMEVYKKVLGR